MSKKSSKVSKDIEIITDDIEKNNVKEKKEKKEKKVKEPKIIETKEKKVKEPKIIETKEKKVKEPKIIETKEKKVKETKDKKITETKKEIIIEDENSEPDEFNDEDKILLITNQIKLRKLHEDRNIILLNLNKIDDEIHLTVGEILNRCNIKNQMSNIFNLKNNISVNNISINDNIDDNDENSDEDSDIPDIDSDDEEFELDKLNLSYKKMEIMEDSDDD
jgi:hypothetical protein